MSGTERQPGDQTTDGVFARAKRRWRRLTTPRFPTLDLSGPVLVFGSAPGSVLPEGMDATWRIVTINGSHGILAERTDQTPDVTLMMFSHPLGKSANTPGVRAQVAGRRTGTLVITGARPRTQRRAVAQLHTLDYAADRVLRISSYQRRHLIQDMTGLAYEEHHTDAKASSGVLAVMLALRDGGAPVVMSGISPGSTGHAYAQPGGRWLERRHSDTDAAVLRRLRDQGRPLYTADAPVAERLGLPLWPGRSEAERTDIDA